MTDPKRDRKSGAIESTRVEIEREVDLRFPHFQGFVTEVSANLSMTGMFVQSENPQPVGTRFSFRFRIEDWKLIQGNAQVIWIRTRDEGPQRPAGMGVRFLELDAQSRRMVRWLVERHLHQGGQPFDLASEHAGKGAAESAQPASPAVLSPPPTPAAGAGAEAAPWRRRTPEWRQARRRRRRTRRLALLALLILAALAGGSVALWRLGVGGQSEGLAIPARRSPAPRATAADAGAAEDPAPSEARPGGRQAGITETVRSWAEAWSEQRADDYLSHYSADFELPRGRGRRQWEAWRRERLSEPGYIRVAITALEVAYPSADRAEATFFQTYRSDRFTDTVRKSLTLQREDEGWKIVAERIVPGA